MTRRFWLLAYYLVASHLPDYNFPAGDVWRRIRARCCRAIFQTSGSWINVEGQVFVGDGRWISLGTGSSLGHGSRVYGVHLGDNVMVGPNCVFFKDNHRFDDCALPVRGQGNTAPDCPVICDGAWIGERAIILPGRKVGEGAVVGAGAVVTKDVEAFAIVAGNPARVVGRR